MSPAKHEDPMKMCGGNTSVLEPSALEVNNVLLLISNRESFMAAPFRFLAWLALPLLALCSADLLADTAEGAPQALHLLDYIGADYPATVEAGKVIDDSEYREQLEFTQVLEGLIAALPNKPDKAELTQGIGTLRGAISDRRDGNDVARLARQLGARLAVAYEVSQAPIITPDPARGAPL
jgi:high-affinity iron transporter